MRSLNDVVEYLIRLLIREEFCIFNAFSRTAEFFVENKNENGYCSNFPIGYNIVL